MQPVKIIIIIIIKIIIINNKKKKIKTRKLSKLTT